MELAVLRQRGGKDLELDRKGDLRGAVRHRQAAAVESRRGVRRRLHARPDGAVARVRQAEGEAEAILKIQTATADGIKLINEANPTSGVIALKSLEALGALADGKANKLIIPSDVQGLATIAETVRMIGDRQAK